MAQGSVKHGNLSRFDFRRLACLRAGERTGKERMRLAPASMD